ncbi:MAG: adenylate/guanylate cyclase domain-containing protein [Chloroflexi bacterium]|nr:MAG: adenylate/guanylate cyclase domain-containing protein [Chloroflexota bacterium]
MQQPQTRYARSGEVNIAYQVLGEGPLDLVYVMGWVTNLDLTWQEPSYARFLRRLASFSRLILFDKRGTGLSDRVSITELPTLEQRMDDVRAVMDAVGSERAALMGVSEGGPMSVLFAATYPERTSALVMYGSYAKRVWDPDYPWAPAPEQRQKFFELIEHSWGGVVDVAVMAPSAAADPRFAEWWGTYLRASTSPASALAFARMNTAIDVRAVLPAITSPTLILHRRGDLDMDVGGSRWMATQIPGARYVELAGDDHLPWVGDADAILDEVEEFLTGVRRGPGPDRVLATILFTDIVDSTRRATELGDAAWRDLMELHHRVVRKELERFRGRELDNAGDGFCAAFDGPARAIRCAASIRGGVQRLGLEVRAGIHTGECEILGDKLTGVAVHTAARVAASAGPGSVLVSGTVRDLVAGSGIEFNELGVRTLKGLPGSWQLFEVGA